MSALVDRAGSIFGRRFDLLLGAAVGLGVALAFGPSAFAGIQSVWSEVVLPAFYTLSTTGLAWCG